MCKTVKFQLNRSECLCTFHKKIAIAYSPKDNCLSKFYCGECLINELVVAEQFCANKECVNSVGVIPIYQPKRKISEISTKCGKQNCGKNSIFNYSEIEDCKNFNCNIYQ